MSYRPHKRKKATRLEDMCIERIAGNLGTIFKPGILSVALRKKILEFLRSNPILVDLPLGSTICMRDDMVSTLATCLFLLSQFFCFGMVHRHRPCL
jgi:hypothetical protein